MTEQLMSAPAVSKLPNGSVQGASQGALRGAGVGPSVDGIADERALDRPHLRRITRVDQSEIGWIRINDAPIVIGDHDRLGSTVDYCFERRIVAIAGA